MGSLHSALRFILVGGIQHIPESHCDSSFSSYHGIADWADVDIIGAKGLLERRKPIASHPRTM